MQREPFPEGSQLHERRCGQTHKCDNQLDQRVNIRYRPCRDDHRASQGHDASALVIRQLADIISGEPTCPKSASATRK